MKRKSPTQGKRQGSGEEASSNPGTAPTEAGAHEASSPTITAPLVFQCLKCKNVLGDSFAMLSSDEATRTVALSGVANVAKDVNKSFSSSGIDGDSTFFKLSCRHCKTIVGKFYLGTPPHLDSQRNLFTLYTDAMSSYQLGTHDLKVETQPAASAVVLSKQEQRTPFPRDVCGDGAEAAASSRAVEEVREEITTDLAKMEGAILALHDRMLHLEDINHVALAGMPSQDAVKSTRSEEKMPRLARTRRDSDGPASERVPRASPR